MTFAQIENNFKYHPLKDGQVDIYQEIRNKLKEAAELINALCPESREKALAFTNLEQSMFWANASIARSGEIIAPAPEVPPVEVPRPTPIENS